MKNTSIIYKLLFCFLIVSVAFTSKAQLVYLGDDDVQKNHFDGYQSSKKSTGLVTVEGKYYFTSPNGYLYETDGTESNTKIIKQFVPQNLPYLKATKKFVYFACTADGSDVKELVRYSKRIGVDVIRIPTNNNSMLELNGNGISGSNLVSEIFDNYAKDALLVRHFANDKFYIYHLEDANDNPLANLVEYADLNMKNVTTPIHVSTSIETLNGDVYWNGRTKPTGEYETSVYIYSTDKTDSKKFKHKRSFELLKNKAYPYFNFFRTKDKIYSLLKTVDSAGGFKHDLYYYKDSSLYLAGTESLIYNAKDFAVETMDDEIYVSYKGKLWVYDEEKGKYFGIIKEDDATLGWDEIQKDKRFLKVGNYYLYRRNGKLSMFDYDYFTAKKTTDITTEALAKNSNHFTLKNVYAYVGKNCFYFTQIVNSKEIFTKYNPATNIYTPIEFPSYKKETFEEIKAIFNYENKFVFLTSYIGKKNKPVYKMFMYTEEGEPLTTTKEIVKNNEPASIEPKPFDAKLFAQQLNTIALDPNNKFDNIKGGVIPYSNGEYSCSVTLQGFGEGRIIDYSRDSKKIRYKAETAKYNKPVALAIIDKLEKEIQALPFPYTRVVEYDVKTRKLITYRFNGKIADIDLDLSTNSNEVNGDSYFTITFRADKKTL